MPCGHIKEWSKREIDGTIPILTYERRNRDMNGKQPMAGN